MCNLSGCICGWGYVLGTLVAFAFSLHFQVKLDKEVTLYCIHVNMYNGLFLCLHPWGLNIITSVFYNKDIHLVKSLTN